MPPRAAAAMFSSRGTLEPTLSKCAANPTAPQDRGHENFTSVIPNAPKITSGKVVAHSERVLDVA